MDTPKRIGDDAHMALPQPAHQPAPRTGEDAAAILDEALADLGTLREHSWLGDAGITVHLLTSLHHQIQQRLPDAVADARDQDYSWAQIAELLGTTRAAAYNRYGRPGRRGQTRPVYD